MILTAALLILIVLPILWVVFVPVDIKVNTSRGQYEIRQAGTVAMAFHPGATPAIDMRVLGFRINLRGKDAKKEKPPAKAPTGGRAKPSRPLRAYLVLVKDVLDSFRCRRLVCDVDTGDVVLNAQIYPAGTLLSRGPVLLSVNFQHRVMLDAWIQLAIHRVIWAFIRFYFTKS